MTKRIVREGKGGRGERKKTKRASSSPSPSCVSDLSSTLLVAQSLDFRHAWAGWGGGGGKDLKGKKTGRSDLFYESPLDPPNVTGQGKSLTKKKIH